MSQKKDAGLPAHEEERGTYIFMKELIEYGDLDLFDGSEPALIAALKGLVSQLGAPLERAAGVIPGRLCEYTACRPVYARIEVNRVHIKTYSKLQARVREDRGGIDLTTKAMNKLV